MFDSVAGLQDVGRLALPAIMDVLCREDIAEDVDMAKAVLETLHILCEVEETEAVKLSRTNSGLANVDTFLKVGDSVFKISIPTSVVSALSVTHVPPVTMHPYRLLNRPTLY